MKIITNPGSNLSARALAEYRVGVTAQVIVVDGEARATSGVTELSEIDRWVAEAKVHPYVVGTTAAEFVPLLRACRKDGEDALVVMSSRKIIGSHDAALKAVEIVAATAGPGNMSVIDTGVTDAAAGLACILAGQLAKEGHDLRAVVRALDSYQQHVRFVFTVDSLDYLVKGGRASSLRAWAARLFGLRPIIGMVGGEVKSIAKASTSRPPAESVADHLAPELAGQPVWAAVVHGDAPAAAAEMERVLGERFDLRFVYRRPISPSIYLHTGAGAVGAAVVPIAAFPSVPIPPSLD